MAISDTSASVRSLRLWRDRNRQKLNHNKWDRFQDSLETQALGSNWEVRMLQEICGIEQGAMSAGDYVDRPEDIRIAIERSSYLQPISDFEFRCDLFFHKNLTLTAQITIKKKIESLNASVDGVVEEIRGLDSKSLSFSEKPVPLGKQSSLRLLPFQISGAQQSITSDTYLGDQSFPFAKSSNFDPRNPPRHMSNMTIREGISSCESRFNDLDLYISRKLENNYTETVVALGACHHATLFQLSSNTCELSSFRVKTTKGYSVAFGREWPNPSEISVPGGLTYTFNLHGSLANTGADPPVKGGFFSADFFIRAGVFFLVYYLFWRIHAKFIAPNIQ